MCAWFGGGRLELLTLTRARHGLSHHLARGRVAAPPLAAESVLRAVARHEPGPASDDRLVLVARLRA